MCVIVNLIYRNEFGFESQILLKHIKYIISCDLFFFLLCKLLFQCIRSFFYWLIIQILRIFKKSSKNYNIRHMEWSEIDFEKKEWIIPANKMKTKQNLYFLYLYLFKL